jgi:hypothetical protein
MLAERIADTPAPETGDDFADIKRRLGVPTTAAKPQRERPTRGPSLRVVPASDAAEHDPYLTLVPPGEYPVGFVRADQFMMFKKPRWANTMQIVEDGPHFGKPIYFFLAAMEPGKKRSPRTTLFNTYAIATGRRPPKNLAQIHPEKFLAGCQFMARVITSTKDSTGTVLPEAVWYSKVKCLTRLLAGVPPILGDR